MRILYLFKHNYACLRNSLVIEELVSWILVKDFTMRPFTDSVFLRISEKEIFLSESGVGEIV